MKSPPGVSANLKLPMREASSMPFSRSKDVSLLTALFSSAAFSCSLRSKRVLPNGLAMRQKKQEKMSFEAVCIGHLGKFCRSSLKKTFGWADSHFLE